MPTDDELGGVLSAYAMGRMRKSEAVARLRELFATTETLPIAPGKELFRATIVGYGVRYRPWIKISDRWDALCKAPEGLRGRIVGSKQGTPTDTIFWIRRGGPYDPTEVFITEPFHSHREVELAPGDQIVVEEVTPWAPGEE